MRPLLRLAILLALTPACTIYFGDDDDSCFAYDDYFDVGLRNPQTGACESYGGGGGGCGGDVYPAGAAEEPVDWGQCPSECETLTETECWAAERCRAVYLQEECARDQNGDQFCESAPVSFMGCWAIAPSGPAAERVACESLDAYECSRHNDCVGNYIGGGGQPFDAEPQAPAPQYNFLSCGPEPGSANGCALIDCGPGYHCEETCFPCDSTDGEACPPFCDAVCVPDVNECPILCPPNSECVQVCADTDCDPNAPDCGGTCTWECVEVGPPPVCEDVTCAPGETCVLECSEPGPNGEMSECRPVCVPEDPVCGAIDCGPGYHCEISCSPPPPCLPGQPCPPPTCGPSCVPDGPPPGCAGITDEMACIAAAPLCRPLYTGTCWVNPDGTWQCVDTEFVRCE